jgi:hypothetical protein
MWTLAFKKIGSLPLSYFNNHEGQGKINEINSINSDVDRLIWLCFDC